MDYEIVSRNEEISPMGIVDIGCPSVNNGCVSNNIGCPSVNGVGCYSNDTGCPSKNITCPPPVVNGTCGGNGGRAGCVTPNSAGLIE